MKKTRRIYYDIGITLIVIVILAVFFTYQFQREVQKKTLNTLSEISQQSVKVIQEEVEKNKSLLVNLAIYIGQEQTCDAENIIQKLMKVDRKNGFKRMGIIKEDRHSFTTDSSNLFLKEDKAFERFQKAMNGETNVSDQLEDLADREAVTVYSTRVTFQDGSHCVLFGAYSIEDYIEMLSISTFGGAGYSYIIKEDGECVVSSNNPKSQKFENFYQKAAALSNANETQMDKLEKALKDHNRGFLKYDGTDSERYLYYQPLGINDWYLLGVISVSVVEKSINGFVMLAYLMLISCVLVILYLVRRIFMINKKAHKRIAEIALVDEVTGYGSVSKFKMDVPDLLEENTGSCYAMVCFNIKKFQYINDLYGYEEGNLVLRKMAKCLDEALKPKEAAARIQADCFAALLEYAHLDKLRNRILDMIEKIQKVTDKRDTKTPYQVKVYAGIYPLENRMERLDIMVDRACLVLRESNRIEMQVCGFYDNEMRDRMLKNKELEDLFDGAMQKKEFLIYYQPKYDVKRKCFCGAEALARWDSREKGMIPPAAFVPLLEENGDVIALDEYIFEAVCKQIREWLDMGISVTPISVNISRLHLYRMDFVKRYLEIIEKYKVPYSLIELEVTETILFENEDTLVDILESLRKMGIRVLMDDFGSGYSSITMLKTMPVDELKLDKCLVDNLAESQKAKEILKSVILLVQSLGMLVIAEGVETAEQYDCLEELGVDYIQGFYCAKPMETKAYEKMILNQEGNQYE